MKTSAALLSTLAVAATLAGPAQAFTDKIVLAVMSPGTINIDGSTQDWYDAEYPAVSLGKNEVVFGASSWSKSSDYSLDAFLASDDANLYLAFAVDDDRQTRTKKPGASEDHVELWIDVPGEGRRVVQFYPERKFPTFHPALRLKSGGKTKKMKGAKFSMESGSGGWEAEIVIPLSSIPGLKTSLVSSRWALVATDSDTKTGEPVLHTVLASAGAYDVGTWSEDAVSLTTIALENVDGVMMNFYGNHKLSKSSVKHIYANVTGDKRLEVLVCGGSVIGIMGPGFQSGTGYTYVQLSSDMLSIDARDVSGNGIMDIVVKYRETNSLGSRVMIAVYSFVVTEVRRILAQEIEVRQGSKSVTCNATFMQNLLDGGEVLHVTPGKATGWTKISYKNVSEYGVGAILLPWDDEKQRLWVLKGFEFKPLEEDKIEAYLEAEPKKGKKGKKKKKKGK
ncbi:MAG: hypothetical protein JRG91_10675 [Deltaproteobacteria bacterium]|nr:hypothetical protein [Deltaproteobacteria bacterium]